MQVLEIRSLPRAAHIAACGVGILDLDDIGAPVGELANAGRAGPHAGQVENGVVGQDIACWFERHF